MSGHGHSHGHSHSHSDRSPGGQLPPDNHVHTEYSYDAVDRGSMIGACQQASDLGLPSIAFTEHLDMVEWFIPEAAKPDMPDDVAEWLHQDSCIHTPVIDFDGYFDSIEECRSRFPDLRILTGMEIGEPHWFPDEVAELLDSGRFERALGSLHSMTIDGRPRLIDEWFRTEGIHLDGSGGSGSSGGESGGAGPREARAVRDYLSEAINLINSDGDFQVFAHIDYLIRQIDAAGRKHNPVEFEEEYRETLKALARSGRALEINTRIPLDGIIVEWFHQVGGEAVSFGSDAHTPGAVGHGFAEAAAMAEAIGFRRQDDPYDFWRRL